MDTSWTLEPPPWGVSPSAPPQTTGRQEVMVRAVGIEPTTHGLKICGEGAKTANSDCIIRLDMQEMRESRGVLQVDGRSDSLLCSYHPSSKPA